MFFRTKIGLHIGSDYLSLAVLKRKSQGFLVQACHVVRLPPNSIRHSPHESNILDPGEIKGHLKKALERTPKAGAISLSIPDLSSRMILIEVKNSIPADEELNRIIKWNMEQKFLSELGDSQISHQLIAQSDQSFRNPEANGGPKTKHFFILGSAVLKNVLSEYESLATSLLMTPKVINNCSFHLFNLYHDLIFDQEKDGNFLFLNMIDQYFTVMVFEQKILRYIRTVGLRNQSEGSEAENKELGGKNAVKIFNEIESSLQYHYKDEQTRSKLRLFIAGPDLMPNFSAQLTEQFKMKVNLLNPSLLYGLDWGNGIENQEHALLSPAIAAAAGGLN